MTRLQPTGDPLPLALIVLAAIIAAILLAILG